MDASTQSGSEVPSTPDAQREAARLRAFLAAQDVPCYSCGRNLRGVTEAVCPGCGAPLSVWRLTPAGVGGRKTRGVEIAVGVLVVLGVVTLLVLFLVYHDPPKPLR